MSACLTAAEPLTRREWTVSGTTREALLHLSKNTALHPGGHDFHPDSPALIIKFFRAHPMAKARER